MDNFTERTIGQIVADDYRAAKVFKKYRIDFCCKGNRTIAEAAADKKLDVVSIYSDLEKLGEKRRALANGDDFTQWPADLLADYIEKKHHRYVEQAIAEIMPYLHKVAKVHGEANPELIEIMHLFTLSTGELTRHMKKEELALFPHIRRMVRDQQASLASPIPHFGTVQNPIQVMMMEHENEGDRFAKIRELTNDYTPPEHACNTYRVTYSLLEEFEEDLHRHIHLENNILFPMAVELEKEQAALV